MITILIVDDEKLERKGNPFSAEKRRRLPDFKRRMERMHLVYWLRIM